MLTAERYEALTGETAPEDFAALAAMAQEQLHARTLQLLRGRDIPAWMTPTWEQAQALQVSFASQRGGVGGLADAGTMSAGVTLGRFSVSGGTGSYGASVTHDPTLSPAVEALLPALMAMARGLANA